MRKALLAAEAFLFTAAVLFDIWYLHFRSAWGDALPALIVIASFAAHRETVESLGLSLNECVQALYAWRYASGAFVACAIAAVFIMGQHPIYLLYRGVRYFVWCVIQQLLFENMIYRRLRPALGPGWGTAVLAGVLFALAHLPNPILVPATFGWGTGSARLFERWPSVLALAVLQTVLSSLLYWVSPAGLSHQFRVGPGYYW